MTAFLAVVAAITAVAKVFPIVDTWLQKFVVWYASNRIDSMTKEDRDSVKKAIDQKDQRDAEAALGNPNAGNLSGIPGTVVRNDIPGVSDNKPPGN